METSKRFLSFLTGATVLLAASPALALTVGLDAYGNTSTSTSTSASASSSTVNAKASANANLGVSSSIWNRCKQFTNDPNRTDDEYDKCAAQTKADIEARTKAKVEGQGNFGSFMKEIKQDLKKEIRDEMHENRDWLRRWMNHATNRVVHMIKKVAGLAKRLCNVEHDNDQTLAKQCLANLKAEFHAKVDAAIEASFSY